MRIIRLSQCASTNLEARKLIENGDLGPVWICSDQQTGGRGRRGREWVSPVGNFYGSFLFPTDLPANQIGQFSFVAVLAVFDSLKWAYPEGDFSLKWPNDTLMGLKKISGMLLETGQIHSQSWVICGIGINLVSHPEGTEFPATSLKEECSDIPTLETLTEKLAERFGHWKLLYEQQGFEPIKKRWLECAVNIPGPVTVRLTDETFSGQALGLDHNGGLKVQLANGHVRVVHAGDVYLG